eukprot:1161072-Pelagomonas_calceolata.AAC.1
MACFSLVDPCSRYLLLHTALWRWAKATHVVQQHGKRVPPDPVLQVSMKGVVCFMSTIAQLPWFEHEESDPLLQHEAPDPVLQVGMKGNLFAL